MSRDRDTATDAEGTDVDLGPVGQQVVFENHAVRVWDVTLTPGAAQPWHAHRNPYLVIALQAGDNRIDQLVGGEPRMVSEAVGGVVYREPGEVHMLTNVGSSTYRSRLIELKMQAGGGDR